MRRRGLPPRSQRHSHGEGIAVRIVEHAVAPAVRPVAGGDEDSEAALARATIGVLRIDPEDTDLGTGAALPGVAEARRPWHALVRVIGVQLQARAPAFERREVLVRMERGQAEDLRVEGQAARDVPDDEIDAEAGKRPAVAGRGHPRLRGALPHAVTGIRSVVRMPTTQSGSVTAIIAAPRSSAGAAPFAARTPPASAPTAAPKSCHVWSAARMRGRSCDEVRLATTYSTAIVAVSPLTNALPPKRTKSTGSSGNASRTIERHETVDEIPKARCAGRSASRPAIGVQATCAIRCVSANAAATKSAMSRGSQTDAAVTSASTNRTPRRQAATIHAGPSPATAVIAAAPRHAPVQPKLSTANGAYAAPARYPTPQIALVFPIIRPAWPCASSIAARNDPRRRSEYEKPQRSLPARSTASHAGAA